MLLLAVINLAKEFDLHSRLGSVVLVLVVVERLANIQIKDYTPLKKFFNDIHRLPHELVFELCM